MIMIKGVVAASRSVFVTLVLLLFIVYVWAIGFRTVTYGTEVGNTYFKTIPQSMLSLFLQGVLPDMATFVYELSEQHIGYGIIMLVFILIATLTVLNMLVGVLVEVVSVVAATEKEQLTANFVRNQLLSSLKRVDTDGNEKISQAEFESLLVNPHAARMVKEVGVDVVGLVELSDFIFQNEKELDLDDFFRLLLELRGSNNATVKDIVDMRKFMRQEILTLENDFRVHLEYLVGQQKDHYRGSKKSECGDDSSACKSLREKGVQTSHPPGNSE